MPTPALLVEDAINTVRDVLRTRYNGCLQQVWAALSSKTPISSVSLYAETTIPLQPIPDNRYYVSEAVEGLQPPAVFIVADASDVDLTAQNFSKVTHRILSAVVVEDVEALRLQRKVFRYAQALHMALHEASLNNSYVLVTRMSYGPTGRLASKNVFRKDVTVHCDVKQYESFL